VIDLVGGLLSALLSVQNLVTSFRTHAGVIRAVDGVSFDLKRGRTLGLVGESGSGKTVSSLSILRLVPEPDGVIESGQILYDGKDLLQLGEREMRAIRGRRISMVFQEAMTALNPVYSVGHQITEVLKLHHKAKGSEAKDRAIDMLRKVGIAAPEMRYAAFAHELSAGMRQRVMIAMALACEPELLIADEPTTALDVTIQAQILDLLRNLQETMKMSILFISHDLGVIAEFAHEMVVMYAGQVVEQGAVADVLTRPKHPYTEALLRSVSALANGKAPEGGERGGRLPTLPGAARSLARPPIGCRFAERCGYVEPKCRASEPPLDEVEIDGLRIAQERRSRCFLADKVSAP
jgi:oligopeptide/dipeptide ABC transporter ATP-binding protein